MEKEIILEAIAREMETGVLVLNSHGFALYANPFLLKTFPVTGGVEGRALDEIIRNDSLIKKVKGFIEDDALSAGDIEIAGDGKVLNVHIVRLAGGGDFSLLLFLHDITEEKRVETIKKDFVANVSHELRTPLASIKGYSETLLDGGIDPGTSNEFLRIIDKHATRMARLIDDLLILSRLESHQMPTVTGSVDMKELIASVTTGYRKQAKDKGVELSVRVPDTLEKVTGDRDRLEQVVVNLLDNAIKYTPSGGHVGVEAANLDGDSVRVDVTDTGIGIPAGDIPRIFERFYRVDKARSRELGGTGLGLAIVKHIIQGLNGSLNVRSTPGAGSTFSFTLRAAR